jgi:polyhydroxyalkanoate synthesis regulator phasin
MSDTKTVTFTQVGDSVRRLQAEADKVVSRVRTRLSDLARNPTKEFGELVDGARRVRGNVRSRVETAVQRLEDRLEWRVSQIVKPVARLLDIASSGEVEELRRRVGSLEKQVGDLDKSAKAA